MYPSRSPLLYVLTLLIIATAILGGIFVGTVILHEPLSLLLVLGLGYLPEFPLVPEQDDEEEELDEKLYEGGEPDGGKGAGFLHNA